jgi:uncharacterized protein YacL (UPF0231 family)
MATKQFDSLFEQIITELTPVGAEYETFAGSLKSGIETAPGGGYLIGKLADVLGKSKEEVVDMISKDLFDKVFPEGTNPANNEDAYRASISNALLEIVKGIEASQGVKVPGAGKAVAGYTARLISQLGDAKKEYGARVSKQEVKAAVEDAEGSVENGQPAEPKQPKQPKAARYIDEAEYEILTPDEMSAAGVELSDDLKTYYSRIENIADQVQKGKDLVKAIQRGGVDTGSAMKATSALIRAGAIKYATAENSDQDIQALDREEGDIEDIGRKEFERSFGKAYKDAIASEPRSMNVGFED